MKKYLSFLAILCAFFCLTACSPDLSGTWYYEGNTEDKQLMLFIDKKDVTAEFAYLQIKPGLFTMGVEKMEGILASGELKGNKLSLTVEADDNNPLARAFSGKSQEFTVTSSGDKQSIILKDEKGNEVSFLRSNPQTLLEEEESNFDESIEDEDVDSENMSSMTGDFELNPSAIRDSESNDSYVKPSALSTYVGTYAGELAEGVNSFTDGAFRAEIQIYPDGTFTQVIGEYSGSLEDSIVTRYGYFDASNQFHLTKAPSFHIAGKDYLNLITVTYVRGVVVEKFGKLYLAEVQRVTKDGSASYYDEDGKLNIAKTVLMESVWQSSSREELPSIEDFSSFYQDEMLGLADRYRLDNSRLTEYASIEGDAIMLNGIRLQPSSEVSPLVKETLTDIATKIFGESETPTINALYQLVESSVENKDTIQALTSDDLSKLYFSTGEKVDTIDAGYKDTSQLNENSLFGSSDGLHVIVDGIIYRGELTDGRFLLKRR